MSYYPPVPTDPHPGARFSVIVDRPPTPILDGSFYVRYAKGPRTRVVFEGETELIERIEAAVAEVVAEIQREIGATQAQGMRL